MLRVVLDTNCLIQSISHRSPYYHGLYPFFSLLKIQPSGTAFAPAKSYTFKR